MDKTLNKKITDEFRNHAPSFQGELKFSEPLAPLTYYRIGGPADLLAVPKSLADLQWLAERIQETGIPYFILGAGSNLLVSDDGFRGLVVRMTKLAAAIEELPSESAQEIRLRVGSGVMVSTLLRKASQMGWAGLEFLAGVPGSVGGTAVMNAGTHLGESKDRLMRVEVFSLKSRSVSFFEKDQLQYSYRKNHFLMEDAVVLSVDYQVTRESPEKVKAKIDETLLRRKNSQPVELPSCGSVFKNPKDSGKHAWQVIEQLGLRGHRIGDAQFSEKHSNFIVNLGKARASDVRALIDLAKTRAKQELQIELEEEVKYLGWG